MAFKRPRVQFSLSPPVFQGSAKSQALFSFLAPDDQTSAAGRMLVAEAVRRAGGPFPVRPYAVFPSGVDPLRLVCYI